jgi:Mitochondrial protein Pet127
MSRAATRAPGRGLGAVRRARVPEAPITQTGLQYRRPPPWNTPSNGAPLGRGKPLPGHRPEPVEDWPALPRKPLQLVPILPPPTPQGAVPPAAVPPLAHGLDVVLRRRGVHPIALRNGQGFQSDWNNEMQHGIGGARRGQTETTRKQRAVPNPEWKDLMNIAQPHEVDWTSIPPYVRASQDERLRRIAKYTPGVRYSGSTSSMTMVMSAMYHAVSNFKNTLLNGGLTRAMADLPATFTKIHARPVAVVITPYPDAANLYSIDAHQGIDTSPAILRDLGHSMERMLTMSGPDFREKMLLKDSPDVTEADRKSVAGAMDAAHLAAMRNHPPQFYHYSQADSFLLRAQIDCTDPQTGNVFDLKTRAVAAIRYDLGNYIDNTHRGLPRLTGVSNSYEREFYDMVRSVFLKYSLQLRIGRMSGAFVTYHNTSSVLGFEYVSLDEMEAYAFGSRQWTEHAFSCVVRLLSLAFDEVTAAMPVSYPDYIKLVIVTHSSQKRVSLYAHRVHFAEGDPLGPEKFVHLARNRGRRSRRTKNGQKRVCSGTVVPNRVPLAGRSEPDDVFDSGVIPSTLDFSQPGAVTTLPGGPLSFDMNAAGLETAQTDTSLAARIALAKNAEIDPIDLRCWDLSFATSINGSITRQPIELTPKDSFELRYKLTETTHDAKRVLRDYINALYECYA